MLSERLASGTPEVVAIAYSIATHLGHHIPAQGENAIIYECLIHDITASVMVKGRFLSNNSPAIYPFPSSHLCLQSVGGQHTTYAK